MSTLIDATLFIQIINFACAYWLVTYLFLKPAYCHIMKIRHDHMMLLHKVTQQEQALKAACNEKSLLFKALQKELLSCASDCIIGRDIESKGLSGAHDEGKNGRVASALKNKMIPEITQSLKNWILHE